LSELQIIHEVRATACGMDTLVTRLNNAPIDIEKALLLELLLNSSFRFSTVRLPSTIIFRV
jgi:hypothetical protein